MGLTTDPADPRLTRGTDDAPRPQADAYLVISEEERAKGFTRPVRDTYIHVGPPGPKHNLRDLTAEERERFGHVGYVKFEPYGADHPVTGRFWTQGQLDAVGKGCQSTTTMGRQIAETYAREPRFYGSTYCVSCRMHRPVNEFTWLDGTMVGS